MQLLAYLCRTRRRLFVILQLQICKTSHLNKHIFTDGKHWKELQKELSVFCSKGTSGNSLQRIKVGLIGNYKTIQSIKRNMVNYRDSDPRRNCFSLCVTQKTCFYMNLKTEANTNLFFPSFLSTNTPLCLIRLFTRKIQTWCATIGCTSTLYHISSQKDNGENYLNKMMTKKQFEIVPATRARSKLNGVVPRAIFSDLIKSTDIRLLRSLAPSCNFCFYRHSLVH